MGNADLQKVGIVVIGRNEGERLIESLHSIRRGAGNGLSDRLVYVDSGSNDGSVEAVRALGLKVHCLDSSAPFTAARARNEGFSALLKQNSALEFVQFVDGDCEMAAEWWNVATAFLDDETRAAAVCGHLRERHPETSIYNKLCEIEWRAPTGELSACGGIAMMRTRAFAEANGFCQSLSAGEEPELCVRLRERKWTIWRIDTEMAIHDAAMTHFNQWWTRMVRNGRGFAEVYLLHRRSPNGIWKRETVRALAWGGLIPSATIVASAADPIFLSAFLLYPIQIVRIALRSKPDTILAWQYACFMTLGKFAECWGICKYAMGRARRNEPASDHAPRRQ